MNQIVLFSRNGRENGEYIYEYSTLIRRGFQLRAASVFAFVRDGRGGAHEGACKCDIIIGMTTGVCCP
jgi:hypothetical protein